MLDYPCLVKAEGQAAQIKGEGGDPETEPQKEEA
jgi:hypothetical protein